MFLAINSIARYEIRSNDRIFAMKPLFYSGTKNASSWAMRAWLALREAGVVFEEEVVDIRRPQRFANLDRIGAFPPPAMVPAPVVHPPVTFHSEIGRERGM